jgi:hypothetical protein
MNVANLQLEGMVMAMAALNRALIEKGALTQNEIAAALDNAEEMMGARGDGAMSPANREAVMFPIRLLQVANDAPPSAALPGFAELARTVGHTKDDLGV